MQKFLTLEAQVGRWVWPFGADYFTATVDAYCGPEFTAEAVVEEALRQGVCVIDLEGLEEALAST